MDYNYSLSVVNISTNKVTNTIIRGPPTKVGSSAVITSISVDPNNKNHAYVTSLLNGTISVINLTGGPTSSIILGRSDPVNLAITKDGAYIYVAHGANFSIINTKTDSINTIPIKYYGDTVAIPP